MYYTSAMKAGVLLGAVLLLPLLSFLTPRIQAESMQSDQYMITDPQLNLDAGEAKPQIQDTYSFFRNGDERTQFLKSGYFIRKTDGALGLSIDNAHIRPKASGSQEMRESSSAIAITFPSGRSAGLFVGQREPLKSLSGSLIDATRCTIEGPPCTHIHAGRWQSQHVPGIGFSVKGDSAPLDFRNGLFFRPFSKLYQSEHEAKILEKSSSSDVEQADMKVRVIKSSDDAAESYQSVIQITAQLTD